MTEILLLTQRLEAVEQYISENRGNTKTLEKTIGELNTTIKLLAHTVETLKDKTEKREQTFGKMVWVFIAGIISAFTTWIVSGGLSVTPAP